MSDRVFLFDLDGTLIDSGHDLTTAVNRVRAGLGAGPLSVATVTGFVGDGIVKLLERALADVPGAAPEANLSRLQQAYDTCALDATRPYPGVPETLDELRRAGGRLAVVTNKPEAVSRRILAGLELLPRLDAVVGGDSTPYLKPDPGPVRFALRQLRAAPDQAWLFGDNWTDLDAGRAAGLRCCFCAYGFGRRRGRASDKTVRYPTELLEFTRSLLSPGSA
ncbi:MAG: HAD hydrolase-like protein [Kiritimatiellaeota bacterium]|nr:HAD hydrolase-like protein [Kiritimatiellota bacterium]